MTTEDDRRVEERAAELLPEETTVGSDDPEAQAAAILADSDERQADRNADPGNQVVERRQSDENA